MNILMPRLRLRGHEWVAYFNMVLQYLRTDLCNTCETTRNNNNKKIYTNHLNMRELQKDELNDFCKKYRKTQNGLKFLISKTKIQNTTQHQHN